MKFARFAYLTFLAFFFISITILSVVLYFSFDLPPLESLTNYNPGRVSIIYSKHYEEVGRFFNQERYPIQYSDIPKVVVSAFIASEDSNFFKHKGVDLFGIMRAFFKNLIATEIKQGGSTITQQVAKTFLLTRERTIMRKIKEVILAHEIEKRFTKDYIIYLYLNQIYLGHGAYGIEAASRNYFDKSAKDLDLAESAMLAGLPRAPGKYSPHLNMKAAKARQKYVLERMVDEKYIKKEEAEIAIESPIILADRSEAVSKYAEYFVEYVRKYLFDTYGGQAVLDGGLTVYTTIDLEIQKNASRALWNGLRELDKKMGFRGPIQILKPSEVQEFLDTYSLELEKKGTIELEINQYYKGVVISVNDKLKYVMVSVGGERGAILLSDMEWARSPDLSVFYRYAFIKKPSSALEKGYVINVKKIKKDEKDIPSELKSIRNFFTLEQEPEVQGAIYAIEPTTGYVTAMVGGYDFSKNEFNRAVQAKRQPGSAFKPIIYAAALDKGYTPATKIIDSPIVYDDYSQDNTWKPSNYEETFHGEITFRTSLIHSYNIPTIKIVQDIGVGYLLQYAKKLGIRSEMSADLSLSLGSSGLTPEELAAVYAVFASGGKKISPIFIKSIIDKDGNVLEDNIKDEAEIPVFDQILSLENRAISEKKFNEEKARFESDSDSKAEEEEEENKVEGDIRGKKPFVEGPLRSGYVISEETAYLITHLLKGVIRSGTGHRVSSIDAPIAGKTGTTNDYIDAWFAGYSPNIVAVVWTGTDDYSTLGKGMSGSEAASPIWKEFMATSLAGRAKTDFIAPSNTIEFATIDPETGLLATHSSQNRLIEAFRKGTAPQDYTKESHGGKEKAESEFFYMDSD